LAEVILLAIDNQVTGTRHWTNAGVASWYDFAVAIMEEGFAYGKFEKPLNLVPICSSEYPTLAQRPSYSVLDRIAIKKEIGVESVHWRAALRCMLSEVI
jgi:dTDP-4-dehydrorhamnose reductase